MSQPMPLIRWIRNNSILFLVFILILLGIIQGLPDVCQAFIDIFGG